MDGRMSSAVAARLGVGGRERGGFGVGGVVVDVELEVEGRDNDALELDAYWLESMDSVHGCESLENTEMEPREFTVDWECA